MKHNLFSFCFTEYFTWQLTTTGVLTLVPQRALQMVSKSGSRGAAELQTGIRLWVRPGYFAFMSSITLLKVMSSLTSMSLSFLPTSTTLSLPPSPLTLPSITLINSSSSDLTEAPL
jgi:hypothetical protein